MTTTVGVIGLGVLGKPVAGRLLEKGFQVAVCDVREAPLAEPPKPEGPPTPNWRRFLS